VRRRPARRDDWPGLGPAGRAQRAQLERRLRQLIHYEPGDEEVLDHLDVRAAQIDPEAFATDSADHRMIYRRHHAWTLAMDEYLAGGDPADAAALVRLAGTRRH
jgi:hypothetical protein